MMEGMSQAVIFFDIDCHTSKMGGGRISILEKVKSKSLELASHSNPKNLRKNNNVVIIKS